jgi:3-dehydroquinate synthase
MITVEVALGPRSYPILIQSGLLGHVAPLLEPLAPQRTVAVVTDANVAALHLDRLKAGLSGFHVRPVILPPGEETKSFHRLEQLVETLLDLEITREDVVLALGGGVIGDLTGFAAAIVKRGVRFVQIPTTLLAMVDSSVGGKTAINTRHGKNLAGAFHQPAAVWIDPAVLGTLPAREMAAGYAEVVKYGLIGDAGFFGWCERHGRAVLAHEREALGHAIATSCRAKAAIVAEDEQETRAVRALLNLGHTFGHALEAETGYSSRLLHGEAVAIGMAQAFRFSALKGLCPHQDALRVTAHLEAIGLRCWLDEAGLDAEAAGRLVGHMIHDKKKTAAGLPFILCRGIGRAFVAHDVALDEVQAFLERDLRRGRP